MQVTPGIVLTSTESITHTKLNLLGVPVVELEAADIQEVADSIEGTFSDGIARPNKFKNPALDVWTRGTTAVSLAVGTRTLRADDWWARCNATTTSLPTYARAANVQQQDFLYCALLTGNTGAGSVDFGQEIAARIAAHLRPEITFTFTIENGTGAALTPQVRLDTCDTLEDFGTVTNRYAQNTATSAASGALTTFSVTIDTSGFLSALRNGCLLYVRFASGTLDSAAKTIKLFPLKLEIGDTATLNAVERDAPDAASDSVLERHFLLNGAFDRWGTTATTCAEDTNTYAAMGWFANPSDGSTLAYARELNAPDTTTTFCAKLTGSVATTGTVDFGQDLRAQTAALLTRQVVFSAYIYNETGADFTPQILIDTCNAADDFSAVTNRDVQSLVNCPNGSWTRVSFAFNGADYTNLVNGCRIKIRFPSGLLATGADIVRIAQAALELGANATDFDPQPILENTGALANLATNLVIKTTSTSALSITADDMILRATDGSHQFVREISLTGISIATSGIGGLDTGSEASATWYYIWVISNGVSTNAILSTSATAPTLPSGYRWRALVGAVRNDGSSNFIGFAQYGNRVAIDPQLLMTAKGPASTNTYEAISVPAGAGELAKIVPPNARFASGNYGATTNDTWITAFAGTSTRQGEQIISLVTAGNLEFSGFYNPLAFRVPLVTAQEFYWKSSATTANKRIEITGYEL